MNITILWADDEIDLLRPHILFLEEKGYVVKTANNGDDAFDIFKEGNIDIVFLDENMPGLSGLETLSKMKAHNASVPAIMITKSEEESIMEDAIGSKIADYLIKPVNPNQILLSVKKNLDEKRLVSERVTSKYQQEFREIGMRLGDRLNVEEWQELYRKMVYWEMELESSDDNSMLEILEMQKSEANRHFSDFIEDNYLDWLDGQEPPTLSHTLFKNRIAPELKSSEGPVFVMVVDNLRLDQWYTIKPELSRYFRIEEDDTYLSILPTATHYARNAIFSGLMPEDMARLHPDLWKGEDDEGGKNLKEKEFLAAQLKRLGLDSKFSYNKVTNLKFGKKLAENFSNLLTNDLNVIVYNFVDMLSHARTDMEVIRELADNNSAYRSLTASWFEHSPLLDIMKQIAHHKAKMIITTDHGTIQVSRPSKVVGDRNTNTNLRYKQGKNLQYNSKEVFDVAHPEDAYLPKSNISSRFLFAKEDMFFVYPNNYNYYVNYYKNTFQHGGISLEEVIIPFVSLKAK